MNDWISWLSSNETRAAINLLEIEARELGEQILNGSHLIDKEVEKIALDFSYSSGVLDGLRRAAELMKDIIEETKESD